MKRILHVEDDERWRRNVQRKLGTTYVLKQVETIPEAKAEEESFDLYVIDGRIVGEDGIQYATELFEAGKNVVIFSAEQYHGKVPYINKAGGSGPLIEKVLELLP